VIDPGEAGVRLWRPTDHDAPGVLSVHGDPRVYVHDPQEVQADLDDARRFLAPTLRHWVEHGFGYWTVLVPSEWWPSGVPGPEGADEDRVGKPFMGRSGQLLDRMLAGIGLDRSDVYIANVVPWRPPGNRTPTPQEIAICRPFIERQIELAKPEFLVCLGGPAAQTLLNIKEGILKTRGRWFPYRTEDGREVRTLATLHPAYLLRQPLQKRLGWRDFQALRRALDGKA